MHSKGKHWQNEKTTYAMEKILANKMADRSQYPKIFEINQKIKNKTPHSIKTNRQQT